MTPFLPNQPLESVGTKPTLPTNPPSSSSLASLATEKKCESLQLVLCKVLNIFLKKLITHTHIYIHIYILYSYNSVYTYNTIYISGFSNHHLVWAASLVIWCRLRRWPNVNVQCHSAALGRTTQEHLATTSQVAAVLAFHQVPTESHTIRGISLVGKK